MNTVNAQDLRKGDTLAGSGFVVTHNAYILTRTPKGKCIVEGHYPNSPVKRHEFGRYTKVPVIS